MQAANETQLPAATLSCRIERTNTAFRFIEVKTAVAALHFTQPLALGRRQAMNFRSTSQSREADTNTESH